MGYLIVNLLPPLTGVRGTLYFTYEGTVQPLLDLPPSVNGVVTTYIATSAPEADYVVIFPEQTIEGVTYAEASSELFNLITNVMIGVTLQPKEVVPPTPVLGSLGILAAVAAAAFILTKKKK